MRSSLPDANFKIWSDPIFQPVSGQKTRVESVLCIPGFARFLNGIPNT